VSVELTAVHIYIQRLPCVDSWSHPSRCADTDQCCSQSQNTTVHRARSVPTSIHRSTTDDTPETHPRSDTYRSCERTSHNKLHCMWDIKTHKNTFVHNFNKCRPILIEIGCSVLDELVTQYY